MNIEQTFDDGRDPILYEAVQLHYLLKVSSSQYGKNDRCRVYKAHERYGYYVYYSINVPDHYLMWDEQANSWAHVQIQNLTLNTYYPFKTVKNYSIIVNRPPTRNPHLYFFDSEHHNIITFKGSTFTRTRPYTKGYVECSRDFTITTPLPTNVVQARQLDNSNLDLRHDALLLATLIDHSQLLFVVNIDDSGACTLAGVDKDSPSFLRPGHIFWVIQDLIADLTVVKVKHFITGDIPTIASGSLLTDFSHYGQLVLHTFKSIDVEQTTTLPLFIANVELTGTTTQPLSLPASAIDGFMMTVSNHTDGSIHIESHGTIPQWYLTRFHFMHGVWSS